MLNLTLIKLMFLTLSPLPWQKWMNSVFLEMLLSLLRTGALRYTSICSAYLIDPCTLPQPSAPLYYLILNIFNSGMKILHHPCILPVHIM